MKSSPWVAELPQRPFHASHRNEADIAIVGGGITGISTAYFLLTRTKKSVMILEQHRMGSGATGYNAGHVVAGFEKPHNEIIAEFGKSKTFNTYHMLDNSWKLLAEMRTKTKNPTEFFLTKSYAGYTNFKELLDELRIVKEIKKRNIQQETIFLVPGKQHLLMIPKKYRTLCKVVSQKKFLSIIPNKNVSYLAVIEKKRGLMNSAYFVETTTNYLLEQYKDRFCVIENEAIKKISLQKTEVFLSGVKNIWKARHIVLCTNGYTGFRLEDNSFKNLDKVFRDKIEGLTGFMIRYEYPPFSKKTHTFGIHDLHLTLPKNDFKRDLLDFSYLYLSERPYQNKILMVVGGIESLKTEEMLPKNFIKRSSAAYQSLDHIVKNNLSYTFIPKKPTYAWQGLMGYTKNLVRIVGKDPIHDRLFYNIGCNGIGILPSIASGERIAKMILGEKVRKTIFDTE